MTQRRRSDDVDDEGVFSREARPVARFIRSAWVVGAAVVTALSGLYLLDQRFARAAAAEIVSLVVTERIVPLEKWKDEHTTGLAGKREIMELTVKAQTEALIQINTALEKTNKKLDALCRASTRPQVCLGGE